MVFELLIDSSAFIKLSKISLKAGLDIFSEFDKAGVKYWISTSVVTELLNGEPLSVARDNHVSVDFGRMAEHIINGATSMDPNWRENRLLVQTPEGEITYIEGNKVSAVDYDQIIICQNNPNFMLVTDDIRLFKNMARLFDADQKVNLSRIPGVISNLREFGLSQEISDIFWNVLQNDQQHWRVKTKKAAV